MQNWIPKFIQKQLEYRTGDVVDSADYNAILNLLITQGDYNSEWLAWLTSEGFAEFFKDLNGEDIKDMIAQVAEEQLASLAAASANKTSAHLNNPTFTFLDDSATTTAIELFKATLDKHSIVGTVSCYSSLVGGGNPYLQLTDLQAVQVDGYAVINHGATLDKLTADKVATSLKDSANFMAQHGLTTGSNIFAYTNTLFPDEEIRKEVNNRFTCAIGNTVGTNDTDVYDTGWLLVVPLNGGVELVDEAIAEAVKSNRWCIFKCDTSEANFNVELLEYAVTKVLELDDAVVTTVPVASSLAARTLNNRVKSLQDEIDSLWKHVYDLEDKLKGYRTITHGRVEDGVPPAGNEGDIHFMYE